jgi:signal transduction histidine kinase
MGKVRQLGIQASIVILTIGLIIGCVGVVGGGSIAIFSAYREYVEHREILRAQQEFTAAINDRALDNLRLAEFVARLPRVHNAFKADNPGQLLAELQNGFATVAPSQIDRMQFYRPEATTFARMHRPADLGEGQTARGVIYRADRDRTVRRGIDLTPNGLRIHGIVPIWDEDNRYLGIVDASTYLSPAFLKQIETGQAKYRIFILGRGGYHLAVESGASPAPMASQETLALTNRGVDVALHVATKEAKLLTTAMPLLDYDKDNIGAVQIDIDMSEVETRYRELIAVLVFGTLLLLVLGAGWGIFALRSLTSPVETLIRTTARIAAGGTAEPVSLQERNDTVGRFARALENLRVSKVEVERQKKKAEEANAAKSKFLAVMSHELRTPLNAVIGFSDLLLRGVSAEPPSMKQAEYLQDIVDSAQHLHGVLTEIMTMARLESGKFEVTPQRMNLGTVVDDVVKMMQASAVAAGVEMTHDATSHPVDADPIAIRQIVLNLLSNALKFTPRGGTVRVLTSSEDGFARIVVTDTGIGIPRDKRETVFLPFEQVEDALSRKNGGIGLGLSIVKSLLDLHRGTITIESDIGSGTRVVISWPAAAAALFEAAD